MLSAMASMWVTIHWASSGLSWNPSSSRTAGARTRRTSPTVSYTHLDVYKRQGLGLSIVRQIVLLHDGDIQAQSEENKGSVFTIELPIATKQVKP